MQISTIFSILHHQLLQVWVFGPSMG